MHATLVDFLESSARSFGPRPALLIKPIFRYLAWSYKDLWEQSGLVAASLQSKGITKGDRLLLWAPNSPYWVVAFFGAVRAGAIVIPLDPMRSPADYVQRVVSKTRPVLAFASRFAPPVPTDSAIPNIFVEDIDQLDRTAASPVPVPLEPDDIVEIMFTSGTTGDPKGVMLSHRNLLSNLESALAHIPGQRKYRVLSFLPLSHMFEQLGLYMALQCGASVTYPVGLQPSILLRTMRERGITTLLLVPQVLVLLMNGIEREVKKKGRERQWNMLLKVARFLPMFARRAMFRPVLKQFGGKLDFIITGGAALDPELGRKWELLGVKVIQGYGATEASPLISVHTLAVRRFDSTGRPVPQVQVRISSEGEIHVRGPNITQGYWEDLEKTASVFTEDGWYKTGDGGFFDARGFLHIQGRKKDMIVLSNGLNVFPEDVESVLAKHPAVKAAAVVGLPRGSVVEVHAALVVEDKGTASEIVRWANLRLASHQQITSLTVWPGEDLPRTHTMKVKKGPILDYLKGQAASPTGSGTVAVAAPAQSRQKSVEQLIAETAKAPLDTVVDAATLGELGLDSLGRVELLAAIEEGLGVYVDEQLVGAETTVRQFREVVAATTGPAPQQAFPRWGCTLWARAVRGVLQRLVLFPGIAIGYRLRVTGRENLSEVNGPVLLICNHALLLDNVLVLKAMSHSIRRRLAVAAAADLWESRLWGFLNPLLGNAFPVARDGPARASLENLGRVLDEGWSVLIYPEGELTVGGPMKPFKSGAGLIAVEGRIPVIPTHLKIHALGSSTRFPIRHRGDIEIVFGEPVRFPPGTPYAEATRLMENAVRAL